MTPPSYRLTLVAAAAMLAGPLWAQTTAAESSPQEIIVTAQRRAETLQSVPAALSAITGEQLSRAGIVSIGEVATRVPGFVIGQQGPSSPDMSIRGIGSTDRDAGSDRSVVVFIDEVYAGRAGGLPPDIFDMERVEVLRGPQGTLYGKNAVGGAVNLVTRRPVHKSSAYAELTAGEHSIVEARGALGGSLGQDVAGRLAFSSRSRGPLYYNAFLGTDTDDLSAKALRGQLSWSPSDRWQVLFSADHAKDKIDGISTYVSPTSAALTATGYSPGPDPFVSNNNVKGSLDRTISGAHVRIDHDSPLGTITWLTGWRQLDMAETRDLAGVPLLQTPAGIRGFESTQIMTERSSSASTELRLASDPKRTWTYLTGVYYQVEDTDRIEERKRQLNAAASDPVFTQGAKTTSAAIFGQVSLKVTETVNATVGARYTRDERDFALAVTNPRNLASVSPATEVFDITASKSWTAFTPKATLDAWLTKDLMTYASIGRGYKAGGYQGLAATAAAARTPFNPEYATSHELGAKSRWLDRTLTLNVAAFQMDYKDLQFRQRILTIPGNQASAIVIVANAGSARIKGGELDAVYSPLPMLSLSMGYSYLDTQITQFNATPGVADVTGRELARAPHHTLNTAADFSMPLGGLKANARVDYRRRSGFWFEPSSDLALFEGGYSLLDARVGLGAANGRWQVDLWGRNLADRRYRTFAQAIGFASSGVSAATSRAGEPRTVGVSLRWTM